MTSTSAGSVSALRIEALDALRGVALFGILAVNLPFLASSFYAEPVASGPADAVTLWLVAAHAFSAVADGVYLVALPWLVFALTGSSAALGGVLAAAALFAGTPGCRVRTRASGSVLR